MYQRIEPKLSEVFARIFRIVDAVCVDKHETKHRFNPRKTRVRGDVGATAPAVLDATDRARKRAATVRKRNLSPIGVRFFFLKKKDSKYTNPNCLQRQIDCYFQFRIAFEDAAKDHRADRE